MELTTNFGEYSLGRIWLKHGRKKDNLLYMITKILVEKKLISVCIENILTERYARWKSKCSLIINRTEAGNIYVYKKQFNNKI